MRTFIAFILALSFAGGVFAQDAKSPQPENAPVVPENPRDLLHHPGKYPPKGIFEVEDVDKNAEFPGGAQALATYIANHLDYRPASSPASAEGEVIRSHTIYVRFLVDQIGQAVLPEIIKGNTSPETIEAVQQLFKAMPRWKPAQKDGMPVNVQMVLPIKFAVE